jgi:hypothetical protein
MPRCLPVALLGLGLLIGCQQPARTAKATLPLPLKELESLVMGQTTDVVVERIGAPDRSSVGADNGASVWHYDNVAKDRPGKTVSLWISSGRIVKVEVD